MKKDYETIFYKEIEKILNEVYNNPLDPGVGKLKRALVKTEKRYIDFLVDKDLIKRISGGDGNGRWGIQLERKGFEVFEKYNGWENYKKQVIDSSSKLEKAKIMAIKYWWLPVLISILSFVLSIIAISLNL